jgi:hypothetical protein
LTFEEKINTYLVNERTSKTTLCVEKSSCQREVMLLFAWAVVTATADDKSIRSLGNDAGSKANYVEKPQSPMHVDELCNS